MQHTGQGGTLGIIKLRVPRIHETMGQAVALSGSPQFFKVAVINIMGSKFQTRRRGKSPDFQSYRNGGKTGRDVLWGPGGR